MTRLAAQDPATFPVEVREFVATLPPDPMVEMMSLSTGTVKPFVQLAKALFTSLQLPARSREVVILAVAHLTDSVFVAGQHETMARAAGVEDRVAGLISLGEFDSAELSASDRALLALTSEIVRQPRVSDDVFDQARRHLTDREIAEVLQVVGYYWSFGRITTTLDVELTTVYGDEPVLDAP
ncbi:carboxymuconolactone decarboxylase family protein [Herbiconiux sp. CPCC 205763]|uniref:Carboxymuconolactone decarboxylase family protein n=1 Tax=Herbiconiux aconitum TaxID=2970913 RepID=A0ABT2GSI8_9MICO|nr:carboxymuconolactone decarboxylase family protein [Herbiconiux aconitum]MCS5717781.1 carboxymuconolactone decarboxylase family protein [Herbiconiux aconitum]